MSKRLSPIWRRILSWVFLILFCLAVPVALVTGWARLTVVNENVYVKTVGAAADDPQVQLGISHAVTTRVEARLAGDNPSATEALQSRVVAEALGEVTRGVVASEEFHQTWEEANRKAHRFLASELREGPGQPVTLDFSPLLDDIQAQVAAADIDVPPDLDLDLDAQALQIEVLDAETADRVRRGLMRLDLAFTTALAVALFSLILSVGLALDRLAAIGRAGFSLAIAMIGLMALMLVTQGWLTGKAGADGGVAIGAILDAISQGLRVSAIALALLGLLVAGLCTGLRALRGSSDPSHRGRGVGRDMTSPRTTEPAPCLIRPAEVRDADAIAAVHRTSMREALPYLPDLHTADEDLAWVANVVLPHQEVWVAEAGGRVVGVAALDGDMLAQLYILPGEQGRGIGSALLAKAMARRPAGMRLYAFQRNTRARAFYERRGFVAVEFGDGSGNEEGEPDVLYQWTPARDE